MYKYILSLYINIFTTYIYDVLTGVHHQTALGKLSRDVRKQSERYGCLAERQTLFAAVSAAVGKGGNNDIA